MDILSLSTLFKAIGEPVRLRLLHLLCAEELSVGELVRIVELPQSTVSRHLKALKDHGLVADRPAGTATFYRAAVEADLGNGETALRDALAELMQGADLPPADRAGLERVLTARNTEGEGFFDRLGARWDILREECFGATFHLEAFLKLLPADWTVADLGTGTGYLLPVLAGHFRRVIGVDASERMIELAERRAGEAGLGNIELRRGDLEHLPLADGEADLAVALLIFHHLADVGSAVREAARALKPGGKLLVVEIHPHENEAFRVAMGDRRPGIAPETLRGWMAEAGLGNINFWDVVRIARPEHELAPLPRLYGAIGAKGV
ncbi:MAG: metalloregulator ArsR/SmtB family transcription factor [Candidatus Sumerlaeaceae bacterium]|nr:metalloregulator ArsR/SmtB family transcription factor [Candidatus Sumerlaeaceae bacterium]